MGINDFWQTICAMVESMQLDHQPRMLSGSTLNNQLSTILMKDQETVQKFIELRAQGWSFVRIAAELSVAKSTPTEWSRKFRFEIHNCRALVLDDLPL
jgi:hypothetical protein